MPQTVPHMPQLFRSVSVLTHSMPQSVGANIPQVQVPMSQVPPKPQELPQPPQLPALVSVSTQRNPQRV